MKLLIITQKVDRNDPILGFFHRWIEEFSKQCEMVTVICLEQGDHQLAGNVRVLSLGKEVHPSKIKYVKKFYKYIWSERKNYDAVFVHMNPEYVVLGGCLWKLLGMDVAMWYVHRQGNLKFTWASIFSHRVLTSASTSIPKLSKKVKIVGHGIDTDIYTYNRKEIGSAIVAVGRVTPIKHLEILAQAPALFPEEMRGQVIGEPVTTSDKAFKSKLENSYPKLKFLGSFKPEEIAVLYQTAFASINATPTGGVDKVVLESFASGCPCFTSNESFREILGEYGDKFIFEFKNLTSLKEKILNFNQSKDKDEILHILARNIKENFSIHSVVSKILKTYE